MVNKLLVSFHRNNNIEKADLGEKVGNFGLGLLRIGFGKTVSVKGDHNPDFDKVVYSRGLRVAAVALFILTLPISSFIAVIGCIGHAFSKSHEEIFYLYKQFPNQILDPANNAAIAQKAEVNPNIEPQERPIDPDNDHISDTIVNLSEESVEASVEDSAIDNLNSEEDKTIVQEVKFAEEGPNLGPQIRRIPPLSLIDTQIGIGGIFVSEHGTVDFFNDDEILENLNIIKTVVQEDTEIHYTKNGKAILQQQATRGCTAASAAMLILDNGKEPDYWGLRMRNLANDEDLVKDIKNTGLKAFINKAKDLSELKDMIILHDSCVGSVRGGHVIVIDEVSNDLSKIRLRDPYHGWEITVGSDAFLKKWLPGNIIQIEK